MFKFNWVVPKAISLSFKKKSSVWIFCCLWWYSFGRNIYFSLAYYLLNSLPYDSDLPKNPFELFQNVFLYVYYGFNQIFESLNDSVLFLPLSNILKNVWTYICTAKPCIVQFQKYGFHYSTKDTGVWVNRRPMPSSALYSMVFKMLTNLQQCDFCPSLILFCYCENFRKTVSNSIDFILYGFFWGTNWDY